MLAAGAGVFAATGAGVLLLLVGAGVETGGSVTGGAELGAGVAGSGGGVGSGVTGDGVGGGGGGVTWGRKAPT